MIDFNGEIGSDQYQWLVISSFCFIFAISLWIRKRGKLNHVITSTVAGLLSYAVASSLFVVPLFFTSDGTVLQYISHVTSLFLIFAFLNAVVLARFIAPPKLQPAMRVFQFVYAVICIGALIVDNQAVSSNGVIDSSGGFMFPSGPWVLVAHLLLNIGPFILGLLLIYNAKMNSNALASKVSFVALGLIMCSLSTISSMELLTNQSFNNQEFTNIRLPVLAILAIIGLSSVALMGGSQQKKDTVDKPPTDPSSTA